MPKYCCECKTSMWWWDRFGSCENPRCSSHVPNNAHRIRRARQAFAARMVRGKIFKEPKNFRELKNFREPKNSMEPVVPLDLPTCCSTAFQPTASARVA